ncbi:MAG: diguanylate cyclase [Sulfurimonas sp.]|nr:diguanylate cyclase [Sulfurimonas sp.]
MKLSEINLSSVLNILLLLIVIIGLFIFYRIYGTIKEVQKDLFHVHIENIKDVADTIDKQFQEKFPNFSLDSFLDNAINQDELNEILKSYESSTYNELYILLPPVDHSIAYKVLAYGDNHDEYSIYDDFEPLNEDWKRIFIEKKDVYFKNGSAGIWFTYQHPIIQDGKIIAVFTVNFSIENYYNIKKTLSNLEKFIQDYNILILLLLLFLIVIAVINSKISKQRVSLIQNLERKTVKIDKLNKSMEETITKRTKELKDAKDTMQTYIKIVDKHVIVSSTNMAGNITYVSKAFCQVSGYSDQELLGKNHRMLQSGITDKSKIKTLWKDLLEKKLWKGEFCNKTKEGENYWLSNSISPILDKDGNIKEFTSISENITDKKRIEQISITDKLTQTYNRVKIENIFTEYIAQSKRYERTFSIIIIDIDYFKMVNDTYGHNIGDIFLKEFSNLLKKKIRETDILGRWGGEEFIVILPECSLENTISLAEKIRVCVYEYDFATVGHKTISSGVAQYQKGDIQETLIGLADEGLYEAKKTGRNKTCAMQR